MDDKFTGGGILIATEDDLEAFFSNTPQEAFDIPLIPGQNIMTGCYGLFLVALDQCDDPIEKVTLEEALDCMNDLDEGLVSCMLTLYYNKVHIDYAGILTLADVMLFLSDETPGMTEDNIAEDTMVSIDEQISNMLGITQEEAASAMFSALGFNPVEVHLDDGPEQLELSFE